LTHKGVLNLLEEIINPKTSAERLREIREIFSRAIAIQQQRGGHHPLDDRLISALQRLFERSFNRHVWNDTLRSSFPDHAFELICELCVLPTKERNHLRPVYGEPDWELYRAWKKDFLVSSFEKGLPAGQEV
jgi:hypothetical protein